jgi:hypothetical protein
MARRARPVLGRRGVLPAAVAAASALLLCACDAGSVDLILPTPTPTHAARPVADTAPVGIAFAPLRGTPADAAALRHPSLAVKIDNHWDARPQIALNRTDLVYEELVEGGLTRYVAVWHSDVPDEVGPVRSVRPMDPLIAAPLGGIIAYSGGQQYFVDLMHATPLLNLVGDEDDGTYFDRADDREIPHDMVFAAAAAVAANAGLAPPPAQFAYGTADPLAAPALAATPTSRIELVFSETSSPSWEWDPTTSAWLRSQEGTPDLEASGDRIRATNVVTLRVAIEWPYEEVPLTALTGTGEAWVSAAGRTAHGTWTKADADATITLTADDGSTLRLAPGNAWIELVPNEGSAAFAP